MSRPHLEDHSEKSHQLFIFCSAQSYGERKNSSSDEKNELRVGVRRGWGKLFAENTICQTGSQKIVIVSNLESENLPFW